MSDSALVPVEAPPHWIVPPLDRTMPALLDATVAAHGDRPAIRYFDGTLSWHELDRQSDALAAAWSAQGILPGDRLVVLVQNIPQFAIFAIAAWKLGAIPVPSNPGYSVHELARLFTDCTPVIVLVQLDQAVSARAALDQTGSSATLLVTDARDFQSQNSPILPSCTPFEGKYLVLRTVIEQYLGCRPPAVVPDPATTGLIMYTSGTTGTPRGAMMRQSSLAFNAQVFCLLTELGPQDRIFAAAPLFHITGLVCHLAAACASGASMILPYRLEAASALDMLREHRPTVTIAAITAFNALMNAPGSSAEDFVSLRHVSSGGAPVAPALHDEIRRRTGMEIHVGYGMTETTSPAVFTPVGVGIPVHPDYGSLSIGIPTPGTHVKIIDDHGEVVSVGDPGEVCMRGPQVMTGYWNKPKETSEALVDGWLRSGDVGLMDEAGWIYLVDRKKDVIIASGFKVWPREVEDVLHMHPAVREAAVVGAPDSYRGETVVAYVSLKPGQMVETDELSDHCRSKLTGYKRPRRIEVIEELPKTVTGKIQRNVLRDHAAGRSDLSA